jgi:hypothetical protein
LQGEAEHGGVGRVQEADPFLLDSAGRVLVTSVKSGYIDGKVVAKAGSKTSKPS